MIIYKKYTPIYYISPDDDTIIIDEAIFDKWQIEVCNNNIPLIPDGYNLCFNNGGAFQHANIYIKYIYEILEDIKTYPNEVIITDNNEIYKSKDILAEPPILPFSYKTVIHLRIEDYILNGQAMDPRSIDNVIKNLEGPYLFVHKKVNNIYDNKYISYFKNKYKNALFFDGSLIDCYSILRTAKILVCAWSSLSFLAALFNDKHDMIYIPLSQIHTQYFITPSNKSITYSYNEINKDELLLL